MRHPEEFGDPVVIPGPNLRSRSTDTEVVEEDVAVGEASGTACPTCGRRLPASTLVCPDDGTGLVAVSRPSP